MNLEEGKEYQLTKELMPLLNLTAHSIKTRKEEYQPLPRKVEKNQLTKERKYDEFTYQALGEEFEPNSKSRVARQARFTAKNKVKILLMKELETSLEIL